MSSVSSAVADPVSQKRDELNDVRKKIDDARKTIRESKEREQDLTAQSRRLDQSIAGLETELDGLKRELSSAQAARRSAEERLEQVRSQLASAQRSLRDAERKVEVNKELLQGRVVSIYKVGEDSYLQVMLGSRSFSDLVTRLNFLRMISVNDRRILDENIEARDEMRRIEQLVANEKTRAQEERHNLRSQELKVANATGATQSRQGALTSEKRKKQELLSQATRDRKTAEALEDQLERESASIESWLAARTDSPAGRLGTGRFIRPAAGRITSRFGYRIHPIYGYRKFHSGIDIGARYGTTISAADGGVVVFSGWRGGYGQAVIIDHGAGWYTLYAHSSRLLVKSGARVTQGQAIARVGSTGASTGPHLHFEVRIKGKPVDPLKYL